MGSRPSFGRRPASQRKGVQEALPCPTGVRRIARRRRDRGAPPVSGSGASPPRLNVSRLVYATARLWGVPAGRALNSVVLRAASGAPSRWPGTLLPPPARHGAAAPKTLSCRKPSRRHPTQPHALHVQHVRPARPHGAQCAPRRATTPFSSCTDSPARRPAAQQLFRARRLRAPGGLARRLGVAAARRLPCSPPPPEPASLFARRRRSSEAQPAQEPPSAAARQSCGTKASTQAKHLTAMRLHT
jgi:hypothetical protein